MSVPKEWGAGLPNAGLRLPHQGPQACLFQAPHVLLRMTSLAGSRLEWCGGAEQLFHALLSFSFPPPGPNPLFFAGPVSSL